MVRSGRLARILVSARDIPGVLARITATVAEAGANIEGCTTSAPSPCWRRRTWRSSWCCRRGKAHVQQVLDQLRAAHMPSQAALIRVGPQNPRPARDYTDQNHATRTPETRHMTHRPIAPNAADVEVATATTPSRPWWT